MVEVAGLADERMKEGSSGFATEAGTGASATVPTSDRNVRAEAAERWKRRFAQADAQVQQLAAQGNLTPALATLYRATLNATPLSNEPEAVAGWADAIVQLESAAARVKDCAEFSASRTVWWLALYEFSVFALAAAGVGWISIGGSFAAAAVQDVAASFLTAVIGGSVYSLYSLYVGALHRALDRDALLWYVVKPVTGGAMGAFVANVALFLAQSATGHAPFAAPGEPVWLFCALVAFFGGYNEKFAAQLTEIFASRVTGSAFLMRQASAKTADGKSAKGV